MALKLESSVKYLKMLADFLSRRKKAVKASKVAAKRKALLEKWIAENGGVRKGAIKHHKELVSQHHHGDWTY